MSFTSLPEEIKENILARVSRWNYPKLSLVSKSFHSLLTCMDIYKTRSRIGTTENCLYVCLESSIDGSYHWGTIQAKPNRAKTKRFKPFSSHLSLPVPCRSTVSVGSEIYVIGAAIFYEPSSTVRVLDCRNHTWRKAPNMKVARKDAETVSLDGKIYVLGGCKSEDESAHWLEVFDVKTQSWTASFPAPCDEPGNYVIVNVVQGKLHLMIDRKNDYTYDPKQGTWKVIREASMCDELGGWCVVENVIYCCTCLGSFMWYDYVSGEYGMVKGLEKLYEQPNGFSYVSYVHYLVNSEGKLLVMWDPEHISGKETNIWFAEISLEKRCNGSEIWGNVEWVDVMFTFPSKSYMYHHCVNVLV